MNWQKAITITVIVCTALAGCNTHQDQSEDPAEPIPDVVTADIQAGIEKHIEQQTRLGQGYFRISFEQEQLKLKLVRVHTEY
ncbi:MAG: transglutaminase domain-containing protein, partial [Planctomycetota bacterium]